MSFNSRHRNTQLYRRDAQADHRLLEPREREAMLKPYLPNPPLSEDDNRRAQLGRDIASSHFGVRSFLRTQFYVLSFTVIHAVFSTWLRFRVAYRAVLDNTIALFRYHHRTPDYIRRDVTSLQKLPNHVSVILTLDDAAGTGTAKSLSDAKEQLVDQVADIAAWCASAKIPMLSVYERRGVLKSQRERTRREIAQKLAVWFGTYQAPELHLYSPHAPILHPPNYNADHPSGFGLAIMFISAEDGRESIVDLTKVLAEMSQKNKIQSADITLDLVDTELTENVMAEPDLLISFAPYVDLQGYPPWQIRLTEIYHRPDNQGIGYQVFLSALRCYSAATFKLGK